MQTYLHQLVIGLLNCPLTNRTKFKPCCLTEQPSPYSTQNSLLLCHGEKIYRRTIKGQGRPSRVAYLGVLEQHRGVEARVMLGDIEPAVVEHLLLQGTDVCWGREGGHRKCQLQKSWQRDDTQQALSVSVGKGQKVNHCQLLWPLQIHLTLPSFERLVKKNKCFKSPLMFL